MAKPKRPSLPQAGLASITERKAAGKARRGPSPRSAHARFAAQPERDVIRWLQSSNRARLTHLVPIRYGRMMHSPYAFLRGAAAVMARDIGPLPSSTVRTQLCGDCHLGNFGGFASAERVLLFGINDFDETLPGPFEWDLKRLAASFVVAAREQGIPALGCTDIALRVARSYRKRMQEFAEMHALELWYYRIEMNTLVRNAREADARIQRRKMVRRATRRTAARLFPQITEVRDGLPRIVDNHPLIYHPTHIPDFERDIHTFWHRYLQTLPEERRVLLDRYRLVDVAIKVVGVGSVGTRCAIALLMADSDDPLFLQFKQAQRSVLEPFAGKSRYANQGLRVVVGQKLLQSASDIFLGFSRAQQLKADFYVRQLRDMRKSLDFETMSAPDFADYADACGWALACAHAKAGDAAMISGYLGRSDTFDRAIAAFANAYADQTERDHGALIKAVRQGRVRAEIERPARATRLTRKAVPRR